MSTEHEVVGDEARVERQAAQAEAFDRIGDRYDAAFPHKEGQIEAGVWLVERLAPGARVLDVGCGTGVPTARQLTDAGCQVTGIDLSEVMLDHARRNVPEATLLKQDVLDITDTGFDAVVAFFSLLMLPRAEIPAALARLHDALTPGGHLLLGMVEADVDDVPIPFLGNPIRVSGYPRDELRTVVEAAGFEVLDLRDFTYAPAAQGLPPETELFLYAQKQ